MDDLTEAEIVAVNSRAKAFLRTGDPKELWPGLSEDTRLAALAAMEQCVAAVLRDVTGPVELSGDAGAIGIAGLTSGIGPLLGWWAETRRVTVNPDIEAVLARHLAHARARAQRLDRGLGEALDTLAAAGVTCTLLKGIHIGRRYYRDAGARPMVDVDLLVAPGSLRAAERALARAGWRRGERQRRPYKCDWQPPGVDPRIRGLDVVHAWNPWSIELHTSLDRVFAPGRHARLPLRSGDDEPWTLNGRPVRVLAPPMLIAYLATHASEESHKSRLMRIAELVMVCREETARGRLAWHEVHARLSATDSAGFAYPALAFAERLVPGTVDPAVLERCAVAAGKRVRSIVEADSAADHGRLDNVRVAEKFMWSRGAADTARRLGVMLWPKSGSFGDMIRTYARRAYRLYHGRFTAGTREE
ncbi:MAG TPA: nucleotidyltransferase family protein [Gemmatimonadaceae bacterium]|nr:nucleotidyltransferase family protein [Gemmatimonadaceae bacterium]